MLVVLSIALALGLATVAPAGASDDPLFPRQWNLTDVGAPRAWTTATGTNTLIGVVDTGVDLSHPDLEGKVVGTAECAQGACRDGGGEDDNGHGTEVSGIAAAVTGNRRGVAGVAPGARLLVAKALESGGSGRVDDINAGIRWVVDHGAKVVNLSLGDEDLGLTSEVGTPLRSGIQYAWSRGAVAVLASGNYRQGSTGQGSPNYGDVDALVVGATTRTNEMAPYSTSIGNAKWGLVAPGGIGQGGGPDDNIITTGLGGGYTAVAGTSAAAPHVAAAVAVLLGMGLDGPQAVSRVLTTLDKVACGAGCQGRLDLAAAVAQGGPPPPPTTAAPSTTARVGPARPATTTPPAADVPASPMVSANGDEAAAGAGGGRNPAVLALAVV
ncbi:MAG: S8 family serine peptidase, partial [Actinobacteria bacterium]|nr:S8 family serine peptidase [Actinomycetota bacterium]